MKTLEQFRDYPELQKEVWSHIFLADNATLSYLAQILPDHFRPVQHSEQQIETSVKESLTFSVLKI